jgi:hypothetical protein
MDAVPAEKHIPTFPHHNPCTCPQLALRKLLLLLRDHWLVLVVSVPPAAQRMLLSPCKLPMQSHIVTQIGDLLLAQTLAPLVVHPRFPGDLQGLVSLCQGL